MIEKTEEARVANIRAGIESGRINPNIVRMVEGFTRSHGFAGSSYIDGVANPGTKSAKSLVSKLNRKVEKEDDFSFTLVDVKDIVRCSIIVDDYAQVVALIKEMQKSIPGLKGDVSENDTGYRGIHLEFEIDGYKTEMQIATREAWFVKQAGEEVYAKWRDFSLSAELKKLETLSGPEYDKAVEELRQKIEEKNRDVEDCKIMFSELFKNTDFDKYRDQINAVLAIKARYEGQTLSPEMIRRFSVKQDGTLSEEELRSVCQEYSELAQPAQDKLISIANRALAVAKQIGATQTPLTREEKEYVLLAQEYKKILIKQMKEKYGDKFIPLNYISRLNKIANERALSTIEYCIGPQIVINSYEVLDEVMCKVNGCERVARDEIAIKGTDKLIGKIDGDLELEAASKKTTGNR